MDIAAETWKVRQVEDSPTLSLEGFTMYRILDGSSMDDIGCEFVVIQPGEVLEPHFHSRSHSIILVIEGRGYALLDEVKYPIRRHSVINVPPGVVHGLESTDAPLIVYGFQSPAIVAEDKSADIVFTRDNRRGVVS